MKQSHILEFLYTLFDIAWNIIIPTKIVPNLRVFCSNLFDLLQSAGIAMKFKQKSNGTKSCQKPYEPVDLCREEKENRSVIHRRKEALF